MTERAFWLHLQTNVPQTAPLAVSTEMGTESYSRPALRLTFFGSKVLGRSHTVQILDRRLAPRSRARVRMSPHESSPKRTAWPVDRESIVAVGTRRACIFSGITETGGRRSFGGA